MERNYSFVPRMFEFSKTIALAAIPEGTTNGPVLEVYFVKKIDRYGIEVAIPSVANPMNTSYVVISREEERFVNEIHDHKQEFKSSNELLANLHESGRNWRKSNQKPLGNLGSSKHEGNKCNPRHPYAKSVPIHKKNHSYE